MKTLIVTVLALLLGSANAGNTLANVGAAMQAQQQAQQAQRLQQCMATCRQGDGQCYQGCALAYPPIQQQPQPQPVYPYVKSEQMDYQCFQQCQQAGYQYGLCKSKCTY